MKQNRKDTRQQAADSTGSNNRSNCIFHPVGQKYSCYTLVQVDTPQDIQNHPADDYVRSLFGAAQPENTASADEVINLYRRLDADGKARVRKHWAKEENKED